MSVIEFARANPQDYRRRRAAADPTLRLMVDHVVPIRLLVAMMMTDQRPENREQLRGVLMKHYRLGVITSDEDAQLRAKGLSSAMPTPWHGDCFARYAVAGFGPAE